MEAVILAGGFGTRLRPLTHTRPKPLLPLLNEPMISRMIRALPDEVERVILAINYMPEKFRDFFDENDLGREIIINIEDEPLGTGGAVKNAQRYLESSFYVLNADVVSSLDYGELARFHWDRGGIGSIALFEVQDPTPFGMVETDTDFRIERFVEKPSQAHVTTNWINAGTYLLEPGILDLMEPGRKTSIEREVFPPAVSQGLYGFRYTGFWNDAGTLPSYLQCQNLLLERMDHEALTKGTDNVRYSRSINHPVKLGQACNIGHRVELGPNVCIGDGVTVGTGCKISNSTIFNRATIEGGAKITDSIVGDNARILRDVALNGKIVGYEETVGT